MSSRSRGRTATALSVWFGVLLGGGMLVLSARALWATALTAPLHRAVYMEKMLGGWAGRMIGVSYGSAYEFTATGFIYDGPIREWQPGFVSNALGQDDLYVEMTFLEALERYGLDITDEQAGQAFAESRFGLAHANAAGRENCRSGIMPPLSGHPRYNPHADDIDFQIEADLFGLITPGMPAVMQRVCDRFGHIMNYGAGVYGGTFIAGMYSAAFFERDIRRVIEQGLRCIPRESKYARLISEVLAYHRRRPQDWRGCWRMLEEKWAPYDLLKRVLPQPPFPAGGTPLWAKSGVPPAPLLRKCSCCWRAGFWARRAVPAAERRRLAEHQSGKRDTGAFRGAQNPARPRNRGSGGTGFPQQGVWGTASPKNFSLLFAGGR
ncbi:MAG: ADP-ribosylglycohydrolase family protein [Armatimonadetes bacterium]|nr:ADP-ribosylglycohydrolase family protein [Armatimonadota bacterium]